jgi:hypothetical protein
VDNELNLTANQIGKNHKIVAVATIEAL